MTFRQEFIKQKPADFTCFKFSLEQGACGLTFHFQFKKKLMDCWTVSINIQTAGQFHRYASSTQEYGLWAAKNQTISMF